MEQLTDNEQKEQLNGSNAILNTHNNGYSELIEGTPFYIRKVNDKYCLTMGNKVVTEPNEGYEITKNKVYNDMWNLILIVADIVSEIKIKQYKEEQTKDLLEAMKNGGE
ncbi:MAG: hypothetical protein [Microviridae sp.]|nr:MAG: hypothetical protein [Microviridae sp.]